MHNRLPPTAAHTFTAVACIALLATGPAVAQTTLADLHGLTPRQLKSEAFTLNGSQDVRIDAVGADAGTWAQANNAMSRADPRKNAARPWIGNAWIRDLKSGKVVWELSTASTTRGSSGTRAFGGSVRIPEGSYEVYYAAFPDGEYWSEGDDKASSKKWHWFGAQPVGEFKIAIRGNGQRLGAAEIDRLRHTPAEIISLRGTEGQQFQQAGFALSRPTEVEIYAVGEAREDGEFDCGWIINADTHAKIWKLTWRDSSPAGGADKNRVARITRTLPAGRYAAFYATDDSHDPSGWNSQPPYDPESWGLTINVNDTAARAAVQRFAYEHVPASATIVALAPIGSNASRKQGFTLTRAMDVRIYALGEGRNGRMYDYGWITSGATPARVWEMRYTNTEPAGGDAKNRLVDTIVHLDKGSYIVHYLSDDSHASGDWNSAAPPDGRHWGITVLSPKAPLDRTAVTPYDDKADPAVIAQLTEVRENDQVRKPFTLDRETTVRIYAVGEGTRGEMVDYGWIEDATGRRVWEMTYAITEHAGGATKNRRFDGTIKLPAGAYVLRYETDGSHSFGDWNAAPPDDPDAWGITLRVVIRRPGV